MRTTDEAFKTDYAELERRLQSGMDAPKPLPRDFDGDAEKLAASLGVKPYRLGYTARRDYATKQTVVELVLDGVQHLSVAHTARLFDGLRAAFSLRLKAA